MAWFEVAPECFRVQELSRKLSNYCKLRESSEFITELKEEFLKILKRFENNIVIPKKLTQEEEASVINFDKTDVVKQMALIDFEHFKQIRPREYLKQGWSKNGLVNSPNIMNFINWFNVQSRWVSTQILSGNHVEDRKNIIEYMIDIAYVILFFQFLLVLFFFF